MAAFSAPYMFRAGVKLGFSNSVLLLPPFYIGRDPRSGIRDKTILGSGIKKNPGSATLGERLKEIVNNTKLKHQRMRSKRKELVRK
jgi:hypothetical protein